MQSRAILATTFLLSFVAIGFAQEPKLGEDGEPCIPVVSKVISGRIIGVKDGDTVVILDDQKQSITVRLEGIDAPENGQDHGRRAKQVLSGLIFGKKAELHVTGQDSYQRTLGYIVLDQKNINLELVKRGWAWHYTDYNCEPSFAEAQVEARKSKLGLWQHRNAIAPWEYRSLQRENAALIRARASSQPMPVVSVGYWLNTNSSVRHNSTCRYYRNTSRGRFCNRADGKACGLCGG